MMTADINEVEFKKLYDSTIRGAYYVARKFLGSDAGVEDVIQDSYIKVYEKLDSYKDGNLQGWVDTIVANKCKDYLKKKNPLLFSQMEDEDGQEFDAEDLNEQFRPDMKVDYDETKRIILGIIDSLPADQRMAVVLYYYEQLGVKEIANACECSENTIKSRLNYARKSIKLEVEKLEKKGTKLYCAPIIPFIIWLFKEDAKACILPAGLEAAKAASVVAKGSSVATSVTAKTGMALGTKIAIGAVATVVVVGGAAATTVAIRTSQDKSQDKVQIEQSADNMEDENSDGLVSETQETESQESQTQETESQPEVVDIEAVVKAYMDNYVQENQTQEDTSAIYDGIAYFLNTYGEDPHLVIGNMNNGHGQFEDWYLYDVYSVDKYTGELTMLEKDEYTFTGINASDEIYCNENSYVFYNLAVDVYYKDTIVDGKVVESEITEDEYNSLISTYQKAAFYIYDLEPISAEIESNVYFDLSGKKTLPINVNDLLVDGWTLEGDNKLVNANTEMSMTLYFSPTDKDQVESIIFYLPFPEDNEISSKFSVLGVGWKTDEATMKQIIGEDKTPEMVTSEVDYSYEYEIDGYDITYSYDRETGEIYMMEIHKK